MTTGRQDNFAVYLHTNTTFFLPFQINLWKQFLLIIIFLSVPLHAKSLLLFLLHICNSISQLQQRRKNYTCTSPKLCMSHRFYNTKLWLITIKQHTIKFLNASLSFMHCHSCCAININLQHIKKLKQNFHIAEFFFFFLKGGLLMK